MAESKQNITHETHMTWWPIVFDANDYYHNFCTTDLSTKWLTIHSPSTSS